MGKRAALIEKLDAETRQAVIDRDEGLCVLCGKVANDVHEILPKSHWGTKFLHRCYQLKNRVCLCRECHANSHTRAKRTEILRLLQERHHYDYSDERFREYLVEGA